VELQSKDLAIGLRLQINQKYVNKHTYGEHAGDPRLGPAIFSLTHKEEKTARGVYTFCKYTMLIQHPLSGSPTTGMCPGGVIVNASHGDRCVAVNGMSYSTR